MAVSLKERVEKLERQMAELSKALDSQSSGRKKPGKDDWQQTIGMSAGDPLFDEMIHLGRRYRERQRPRPARRKPNART